MQGNFNFYGDMSYYRGIFSFRNIDGNWDGKIDELEYNNIKDKLPSNNGDMVDISVIDRDGDRQLDEKEFDIWKAKLEMQDVVNSYYGQIAVDFCGASEDIMKQLSTELKNSIDDYIDDYLKSNPFSDAVFAALDFKSDFSAMYEEIKNKLLNKTQAAKNEDDSNYRVSSKIMTFENKNIFETQRLKQEINNRKEDYREQLKAKLGEKFDDKINALFDRYFDESVDAIVNSLVDNFFSASTTQRFLQLGLSLSLKQTYQTNEILEKFDDIFNAKMTAAIRDIQDNTKVSSKTMTFENKNINRTNELKREINNRKEDYREQLKAKLGEKFDDKINALFERYFDESVDAIVNSLVSNFFSASTTQWFLQLGLSLSLSQTYKTNEVLESFDNIFNAKMSTALNDLQYNTRVTSTTMNIENKLIGQIQGINTVKAEINKYKEQYREQLKTKLGENFDDKINSLFDRYFEESVTEVTWSLLDRTKYNYLDENTLKNRINNNYNLWIKDATDTIHILEKFDAVFNTKMEEVFKILNIQPTNLTTNEEATVEDKEDEAVSAGTKFQEIFNEMKQNVPDSTSTIEEKELAISYIDRMLACPDIPNAEYWENNKEIILQEIEMIKNEQKLQSESGEKVEDVWQELSEFVSKYQKNISKKLSIKDRLTYYVTYNNACISFYQRLLNCSNLTDELKTEYENKILEHRRDINRLQRDYSRESFVDVYKEMQLFVPDVTTTIAQKELAISYIERMLDCDDIPNADYWIQQKEIIEQEIKDFNNED